MPYFQVNHLAVLTAAVVQFLLGWLWFGVLFKKAWLGLVGQKEDAKPANPAYTMVMTFVANLILSFVLAHLVIWAGGVTFSRGAFVGLVCGLGFVLPPMFAGDICERRPFKLFGINAVYWMIGMMLSGGILAVWK
jgi:MFS family permease